MFILDYFVVSKNQNACHVKSALASSLADER